ncbi:hypothetical protein [Edaphovirga cremea]|uniref:hypothetical protein n=1 Tax=Edaphovirga cremea TaxID=2267246 RepID=UPI00398A09CA
MIMHIRNIAVAIMTVMVMTGTGYASSLKTSCPAVESIQEKENMTDKRIDYAAVVDGNTWTGYYKKAKLGALKDKKVTLNQVSIEDNQVQCYYQSANPKEMSLTLTLSEDFKVTKSGENWNSDAESTGVENCTESNPALCKFDVETAGSN